MGMVIRDDGWRIPDEMWAIMEPLLPPRKPHPLGCHNPRVSDRAAMNAIFFILRTGAQWHSLDATGICSCSSAYRRFREWTQAGVFEQFWRKGLIDYDRLKGLDWRWCAMDGIMTKAPLGGEKNRPQPHRSVQNWGQTQLVHRGSRSPDRHPRGRSASTRHEDGSRDIRRYSFGAPEAHHK